MAQNTASCQLHILKHCGKSLEDFLLKFRTGSLPRGLKAGSVVKTRWKPPNHPAHLQTRKLCVFSFFWWMSLLAAGLSITENLICTYFLVSKALWPEKELMCMKDHLYFSIVSTSLLKDIASFCLSNPKAACNNQKTADHMLTSELQTCSLPPALPPPDILIANIPPKSP